jgi:hypothetical protein
MLSQDLKSDADRIVSAIEDLTSAVNELAAGIDEFRDLLLECTFVSKNASDYHDTQRTIRTCDIGRE